MTFEEFYSKYKTGEKELVEMNVVGMGNGTVKIPLDVHKAPFGDLVKDYVTHVKLPWWKRDALWSMVEERLRDKLNLIGNVIWHG